MQGAWSTSATSAKTAGGSAGLSGLPALAFTVPTRYPCYVHTKMPARDGCVEGLGSIVEQRRRSALVGARSCCACGGGAACVGCTLCAVVAVVKKTAVFSHCFERHVQRAGLLWPLARLQLHRLQQRQAALPPCAVPCPLADGTLPPAALSPADAGRAALAARCEKVREAARSGLDQSRNASSRQQLATLACAWPPLPRPLDRPHAAGRWPGRASSRTRRRPRPRSPSAPA